MKADMRIISLIPSATEILCALGLTNSIVGRSHECDFPLNVQNIPICTKNLIDCQVVSKKIDEQVRFKLISGLSIYELDLALLTQLNPSLIVTQSQCDVCAVDLSQVQEELAHTGLGKKTKIVTMQANDLKGIFQDIQRVAEAVGKQKKGQALIATMVSNLLQLHSHIPLLKNKPKVACIEWIDPLMAAGNWIPALVKLAGAENLFSLEGSASPSLTKQNFLSADPDAIIFMACGFGIERTIKELELFFKNQEFQTLKSVRDKRVYVVDGNHFFVRPGPRIVDSFQILCEILHPGSFSPKLKGLGWENVS